VISGGFFISRHNTERVQSKV